MREWTFVQLAKDKEEDYDRLVSLMLPYIQELDSHRRRETPAAFIQQITRGMLAMQGPADRHLELCYEDAALVGFFCCKVDHPGHKGFIKPGYGYVMEFYILPEFRRRGYGTAIFRHVEALFRSHGTKRLYLTADPVTGLPFWEALGFAATGEVSPENGLEIYEKELSGREPIITIQISKYLTNSLAQKIAMAQWHSGAPEWSNRIRWDIYDDTYFYDGFQVVAMDQREQVVGRLHGIQNESDKRLWYYGDLFVIPAYRRMGIATHMIKSAVMYLCERNARTLRAYVSPDNIPSIALHKNMGFTEKPYQPFNNLISDGDTMFELELPSVFSVIPAGAEEAGFVSRFYLQNREALHGKPISPKEWEAILSADDEDERNFLVCRGCMPVAWLRINGLLQRDMAWIGMLVVSDKHQRQGVGSYAVSYAEEFVRQKGFQRLGIHTTGDNLPAQNLYRKCGYTVSEQGEYAAGDGSRRMGYTFVKDINALKKI